MKLDSLLQHIGKAQAQHIPPLEHWQPELSGDIDMEIKADGSWWHEGEQIKRQELVNLFSSILRKEGDEFFLVTPVEKWRLTVVDRPLLITLVACEQGIIKAITATADSVELGVEHPLKMSMLNGVAVPEVQIRAELWARFSRNAWYELLQCATTTDDDQVMVHSHGVAFSLSN